MTTTPVFDCSNAEGRVSTVLSLDAEGRIVADTKGQPRASLDRDDTLRLARAIFTTIIEEELGDAEPLSDPHRAVYHDVRDMVPSTYRVTLGRNSVWEIDDEKLLARLQELRLFTLATTERLGIKPIDLATALLELSAALFEKHVSRDTFLDNARSWYDSAHLVVPGVAVTVTGGQA